MPAIYVARLDMNFVQSERALIGKEEGDSALVQAPGGSKTFEIVSVSYK